MAVILTEENGKYSYAYNLEYCKGCGICANECPTDSIVMENE
jgi:pyruvate ferredoxin oxidoreductase delta subunit